MVTSGCLRHTCENYQEQRESELGQLPAIQPGDQQQRWAPFWEWERNQWKESSDYMVNMIYTSDLNITTDDTVSSVVPILGGQWNIFELIF
jgi:hypothetical protein